jgi:glycosyltransferase involved in cell wall biosynthesis
MQSQSESNVLPDSPEVSVVIPCFNHGSFLLEALESLRDLSDVPLEIIIVDDGSTDPETIEILRELSIGGLRVLHQKNSGVAAARNHGIAASTAPFYIPLDSDNLLFRPYFEEGLNWLRKNPDCAVVFGDAKIFGEKEGTWCNHPVRFNEMAFENYIDNCALIRKSAWEKVGGYDVNVPIPTREDYIFWLDLLKAGFGFHHLSEFCFAYRFRNESKVRKSYKDPRNRILIQEYVFKKQRGLLNHLVSEKKMAEQIAVEILGRHHFQLAHNHLAFGSVVRGYSYLWIAMKCGFSKIELIKSSISWPLRRIRNRA